MGTQLTLPPRNPSALSDKAIGQKVTSNFEPPQFTSDLTYQQVLDFTDNLRSMASQRYSGLGGHTRKPGEINTFRSIVDLTEDLRKVAGQLLSDSPEEDLDSEWSFEKDPVETCYFCDQLPLELRVRIYEYALIYKEKLVPTGINYCEESACIDRCYDFKPTARGVSIFRLNKQISQEAMAVFYKYNQFALRYGDFRILDKDEADEKFSSWKDDKRTTCDSYTTSMLKIHHLEIRSLVTGEGESKCKEVPIRHLLAYLRAVPRCLESLTICCIGLFDFLAIINEMKDYLRVATAIDMFKISIPGAFKSMIIEMPGLTNYWKAKAASEKPDFHSRIGSSFPHLSFVGKYDNVDYYRNLQGYEYMADSTRSSVPSILKWAFTRDPEDNIEKLRIQTSHELLRFNLELCTMMAVEYYNKEIPFTELGPPGMPAARWLWSEGLKSYPNSKIVKSQNEVDFAAGAKEWFWQLWRLFKDAENEWYGDA